MKKLLDGENLSKTEISFLQAEKELLQKKLEIHLNMWELDKRLLEQNHVEVSCMFFPQRSFSCTG